MPNAVIPDAQSLGPDIDLTAIRDAVTHLETHQQSTTAQARERLADAEIAIVNKVRLDAETLSQLPSLRLICVLATGLNNIDLDAVCVTRRLPVREERSKGWRTRVVPLKKNTPKVSF